MIVITYIITIMMNIITITVKKNATVSTTTITATGVLLEDTKLSINKNKASNFLPGSLLGTHI